MSVETTGKDNAWDRGDCRRLRRTASRHVVAARMRRVPHHLAALERQRVHAPACGGIDQHTRPEDRFLRANGPVGNQTYPHIGERDVDIVLIDGRTPLNATQRATLAEASLP